MRIAVIGTGISSLTAAHLLSDRHELTLFDSADYIGGHTNTIDVDLGGEHHAIDTGFIVFNEPNYPNFCKLMSHLGVESQPTNMSFSVRCDDTGLEYNGTSLNTLFAQRANLLRPKFWRMIAEIVRFGRLAPGLLETVDDSLTVEQYVSRQKFSSQFVKHYLVPLGASLWSCPADTFLTFPIRFVVEFLNNHRMLQIGGRPTWRVIRGGSKQYVGPLTKKFRDRIRLRTPVESVQRLEERVEIKPAGQSVEAFDHVVLGCHADTALKLLADPSPLEREVLGAFPYQPNEAILHTDSSVLPRNRHAWAAWNYRVGPTSCKQSTVTYDMNILQGLTSKQEFCVTLNDDSGIDPSRIIKRIAYDHPIYTAGRSRAQHRHGELIGHNRTSFCGAYWGFGFHEDGVRSGLAVARSFGEAL